MLATFNYQNRRRSLVKIIVENTIRIRLKNLMFFLYPNEILLHAMLMWTESFNQISIFPVHFSSMYRRFNSWVKHQDQRDMNTFCCVVQVYRNVVSDFRMHTTSCLPKLFEFSIPFYSNWKYNFFPFSLSSRLADSSFLLQQQSYERVQYLHFSLFCVQSKEAADT